MKNKFAIILMLAIWFVGSIPAHAQTAQNLNNYKYVIIPVQFSFQNKENEFLLNSRVKHLFNKEGFQTIMSEEKYPNDLAKNPCMGLTADVKSLADGFFSSQTQLKVVLKNCHNEVVYTSPVGKSREKDYAESYKEAIRDAFKDFVRIDYKYNGKEGGEEKEVVENSNGSVENQIEKKLESPLSVTLGKVYKRGQNEYEVNKIEAGYLLINKKTQERVAVLNVTENHTVLFNSKSINGTASIKDDGDIITVEYFNQDTGKMKKIEYVAE